LFIFFCKIHIIVETEMNHLKPFVSLFKIQVTLFLIIIVLAYSSCVTTKRQTYMQSLNLADTAQYQFNLPVAYNNTIKPFDELFIKVVSTNIELGSRYNYFDNTNMATLGTNLFIITYTVNDSGYIYYPYIGKIYVKDKTLAEATQDIRTKLSDFIESPEVLIKQVDRNFTVLGEVRRPGNFVINKDQITILQAIGMAGDIAEFGNRQRVTIIRQENDKTVYHYLNLLDKQLVESANYYIKPNDIIYVEPLKSKFFGFQAVPYTTILSSVTTLITLMYFLRSVK